MARVIEYAGGKIHERYKNGKELEGAGEKGEERKKKEGGKEEERPKSTGVPSDRNCRPGIMVLWAIRRFQKTTGFLINKLPFV